MGRITSSRKQLTPDPRHESMLASKFINCLMHDGKKSTAQAVFYDALGIIRERVTDVDSIEVFTQAVENVKPAIEVRSKRVGGAAYQVPMQVNRPRQQSLAIRWILMAVRERKGRATHEKLAEELIAAYKKEGTAMARRDNVLLVPSRAIRSQGRSRVVEVMVDGKRETRTVSAGMSNDQSTEVTDGLREGDLVVIPATTTAAPRVPQTGAIGGMPGMGVPPGGFGR